MGTWFKILEAARQLAPREGNPFTASELSEQGDLSSSDQADAPQIAAAWIGKFVKWGYARKIGEKKNPGKKPQSIYTLTDYGLTVSPKISHKDRLQQVLEAVSVFQKLRGKPAEGEAWRDLLSTAAQITKSLEDEEKARRKSSR